MSDEVNSEAEGGESACFAHLICPECGAVLDGSAHVVGCTWVEPESDPDPIDDDGSTPKD